MQRNQGWMDGGRETLRSRRRPGQETVAERGVPSFDEFAEQAVKYGVSTPTYTAPPSGHFSTWAGAVNAIFDALNIWIRSGGKKTP